MGSILKVLAFTTTNLVLVMLNSRGILNYSLLVKMTCCRNSYWKGERKRSVEIGRKREKIKKINRRSSHVRRR
ncbi:hypothetical protein Hanom_Chr07g00631691 [Helianthus anomalus]